MPCIVALSPLCPRARIERAAMRVVPRPNISPLCILPSIRSLHGTALRAREPAIFKNSLEKTLEAHRVSNRASIIRRVVSKGTLPADNPSENHVSNTTPTADAPPGRKTQQLKRRKTKRRPSQDAPHPAAIYPPQIIWSADPHHGRPTQSPWLHDKPTVSDSLSQLDDEIQALESYLTPTRLEEDTISQVTAEITSLLEPVVPQPPVVIGSRRTGFAMSHSDLNLMLPVSDTARSWDQPRKPSSSRPQILSLYRDILHRARATLRKCPSFQEPAPSPRQRQRYSAITMIHRPTGLPVRLSCGEDLPASLEYIQDYHAEYPSLRPLYLAARLILETHGLYGTPTGGLSSDALLMLLTTFLKTTHGQFRTPNPVLAPQLLGLLRLYGTDVDLAVTGVAADPPCFFTVDSVKRAAAHYADPADLPAYLRGQRSLLALKRTAALRRNVPAAARLCLQDPANYMNDLGRGCTRTREIQEVFARTHERLDAAVRGCGDASESSLERSVLARAFRANFDDFTRIRARIASPAVATG
ncbi:hypothetical protein BDV59DRAFT_176250 [Aspergillus ambiguus]|uniref:uncharacterized protein n=1 Tax=Aspergillus ambiguus TaxID=176160 RepID=UPI003CCD1DCD